jgi:hypothetical protein
MATFTLDYSLLAGLASGYAETIIEDRGRAITIKWSQGGLDEDLELLGYSVRFAAAEPEAKEVA